MAYTGITGTVQGASPNFDPGVICGANLDLSGVLPAGQVGNSFSADGELWIGSTSATAGGTHSRIGIPTSLDGSVTITPGSGTLDFAVATQQFAPNAILQEFDDFLCWDSSSNAKLAWNTSSSTQSSAGTVTNPGIIRSLAGAGTAHAIYLNNDQTGTPLGCFVPGGGTLTISWTVKLGALSGGGNTYRYSVGICDQNTVANFLDTYVNAVYFQYTDTVNSGNWQIKCTSAGVTTTVNTSVAADTDFHTFTFVVNAAATNVDFYIDGAVVGTAITTDIPTTAMTAMYNSINTAGTMPELSADLFWVQLILSNARPGPAPTSGSTGRLILTYRNTAVSTLVTGDDAIIGVTDTSAARTITMPAAPAFIGQVWTIKDESGAASTNNITVDGNGNLIDGAATILIDTNYGSINLYWNGTNFSVT